eukprot:CAMPEP_0195288006 /NCGR_PEP_ID=MMETSP0707-20130614/4838_1 /TAXON_ID=33640 /ORGANISM="Asterionellopsis glacialis, Strain CCMP134" /LENGTH=337 /DNA_ID=CAMNT_0040347821 /DNA_START=245 /DNA_END=1258 /DNA_ORIENTATION=+
MCIINIRPVSERSITSKTHSSLTPKNKIVGSTKEDSFVTDNEERSINFTKSDITTCPSTESKQNKFAVRGSWTLQGSILVDGDITTVSCQDHPLSKLPPPPGNENNIIVLATTSLQTMALVFITIAVSSFTVLGRDNRKHILYDSAWWKFLFAISSISPWLVLNTPRMLRSKSTRYICLSEWTHCVTACFHHILEADACVDIVAYAFPLWMLSMERHVKRTKKEHGQYKDENSNIDIDMINWVSIVIYMVGWLTYGEVFIVSGAGLVTLLTPFIRHGRLATQDKINACMISCLFVLENWSIIEESEYAQIVHFVCHYAIHKTSADLYVSHNMIPLSK